MDWFKTDLRGAVRSLANAPAFTAVAVAALALGIGATTAIFSVVDRVLLRPLPYAAPDRIMALARSFKNGSAYLVSIPKFMAWARNQSFEAIALYDFAGPGLNVTGAERPEQVKGIHVSRGFFRVFGVAPALGRTFTEEEDRPNGPRTAVISGGLWKSRFGADPGIIGRTLNLNGEAHTVVGILPAAFHSDPPADVWLPLQADPASASQGNIWRVAGRLKPGVSVEAAKAEMKVIGDRFHEANPKWMQDESIAVLPLKDVVAGDIRPALLILFGAVGFVLLIACANVANLLLARSAGRQKEIAIRGALGASRFRVIRQLLTESLLLAGLGAAAGFATGGWGVRLLLALSPGDIPRLTGVKGANEVIATLDWHVLAFTICIALITAVAFGLFPAMQMCRTDVNSVLMRAGGRSGSGLKQNRIRGTLVVTEIALALVLMIGAALMIRSFMALHNVSPGFDAHNILTFQSSLAGVRYSSTASVHNLTRQAVQRIEGLPGVQAAAVTVILPLEGPITLPFTIEGQASQDPEHSSSDEQLVPVTPHYFRALRIALLRGRMFRETDSADATRVVIVNEAMARKYWSNEDPLGRRISIGGKSIGPEFDEPPRQIVGVAANVRNGTLDRADQPVMYVPAGQVTDGFIRMLNRVTPLSWVVRTSGDPLALRNAVQREILSVDGEMPISKVRTMEQVLSGATARQNFNMVLLSVFAGMALLLAAIGIYGLMSYSVERRTHEIGIRMALGACPSGILKLMGVHAMRLALAGVAIGVGAAYGLTRLVANLLFEVRPTDPRAFAAVAGILTAVALLASYIPARRAAKVDPIVALHCE